MKNICRPFTLFSDFLPPGEEAREWDYLSFGYFDGLNVGENLFASGKTGFEELWNYTVQQKRKLNGSYSEQTIFGFRCDEDTDVRESNFWEHNNDMEYPFLFIVLIQDAQRGKKLTELWEGRRALEVELSDDSMQAISYLTLDTSDLLLVLKCREYERGAKTIDGFHTGLKDTVLQKMGWQLRYSYSICSVRKEVLNDVKKAAKIRGIINTVHIHVIEKYPGSIEKIYNDIKKKFPGKTDKRSVLGCNDEVIILKDIPWNDFLLFYADQEGLLNHSSQEYRSHIIGVTTILGEASSERKDTSRRCKAINSETLSEMLRKKISREDFFSVSENGSCQAVKKGLLSILNSLEKYEKAQFDDYTFISSIKPMEILIRLIEEAGQYEISKYAGFYEFLEGFNLYTQNSVHSDRQFTEVPDFNIRIYDTPVKMNAFYNAVIAELKKLLNTLNEDRVKRQYEFLACPGVVDNMQVREIYHSVSDALRLFLVDIPEKQVFDPKLMMIMLSHEISHFVGRGIRKRDYRLECMNIMLAKVFVRYLRQSLRQETAAKGIAEEEEHFGYIAGDEYWSSLEREVKKQLLRLMPLERENRFIEKRFTKMDEDKKEWWKKYLNKYSDYTRMLVHLLPEHMNLICWDERLFLYPVQREELYQLGRGETSENARSKAEKLKYIIDECKMNFVNFSEWNRERISVYSVVDKMVYLFKECFADLGAVLLLNLSIKDYLWAFLKSAADQGMNAESIIESDDLLRILLISYSMMYGQDGCSATWKSGDLTAFAEGGEENYKLAVELDWGLRVYFSDEAMEDRAGDDEWDSFQNSAALIEIAKYLVRCRQDYEKAIKKDGASRKQKELVNIFAVCKEENIEIVISQIQIYIDAYRKNMDQELRTSLKALKAELAALQEG
nr:hypothetical protein [uncultured Eisenbergiella sp.]